MLNIGVCDDDPLFISLISKYISDYCKVHDIKSTIKLFQKPEQMLLYIEENSQLFDIIFLDIDMPGMDGHELAERLRSLDSYTHFELVFVTSHVDQMQQSFRYLPRDFISKSELKDRLPEVMSVLLKHVQNYRETYFMVLCVSENHRVGSDTIRSYYVRAPIKDIRFVEIVSGKIFIDIATTSYILKSISFTEISDELEQKGFINIYRGTIVNPEHIKIIEQKDVILLNGDRLRMSRYLRKEVSASFATYVSQQNNWRQ